MSLSKWKTLLIKKVRVSPYVDCAYVGVAKDIQPLPNDQLTVHISVLLGSERLSWLVYKWATTRGKDNVFCHNPAQKDIQIPRDRFTTLAPAWKPVMRNRAWLGKHNREFKHARFWDADGNRKWAVFPLNLSSHNHIYIAQYLFSIRDD